MTPETIKAAIHETNYKSDDEVRFDELEIILTRILCPAPTQPETKPCECGKFKIMVMTGAMGLTSPAMYFREWYCGACGRVERAEPLPESPRRTRYDEWKEAGKLLRHGEQPAPAARPDSAGEGGKDRARELASQIVMLFVYEPSTKDALRVGETRDSVESVLKLYGNELLEKVAAKLEAEGYCHSPGLVREMKSS